MAGPTPPTVSRTLLADWDADSLGLSQGQTLNSWPSIVGGLTLTEELASGSISTFDDGSNINFGLASVLTKSRRWAVNTALFALDSMSVFVIAKFDSSEEKWMWNRNTSTGAATIALRALPTENGALVPGYRDTNGDFNPYAAPTYRPERITTYCTAHTGTVFRAWADGVKIVPDQAALPMPAQQGSFAFGGHPTVAGISHENSRWFRILVYDGGLTDADYALLHQMYLDHYSPVYQRAASPIIGNNHSSPSAWLDGSTYHIFICDEDNDEYDYYTAPESDPSNWALQQLAAFVPTAATRGSCLLEEAGTWYLFYDNRTAGNIAYASGPSPTSLVVQGTLFTGSPGNYYRHPAVVPPSKSHDGNWQMILDIRTNTPISEFGHLSHASGPNLGALVETGEVISPSGQNNGWRATDVGSPSVKRVAGQYELIAAGYNSPNGAQPTWYPHSIGRWSSSDCVSWTEFDGNPVLDSSQDAAAFDAYGAHEPEILEDLTLLYTGFDVSTPRISATAHATFFSAPQPPSGTKLVMLV